MKPNKEQALETLKKILLAEDWNKLKHLETELSTLKGQIEDKESLIASLDPVIADLLERKIIDSTDEMAEALAPVMSEAIKRQVSEAKDDVVDALYPVIGQTIRKAVAEAMKKLVENVNQKIDQTLRRPLFKKRLQAKITGVSKGELVLKDAMPFQINEIFLIHKASGLLISHVSSKEADVKVDQELIGGMLTAIKDFVPEAFTTDERQDLDQIQYGDAKILLEMGRYSYLAIVISGIEPVDFRADVQKLGRRIHNRFHKLLRQFDGDMAPFGEIAGPLQRFLEKYRMAKVPEKSKPFLIYFLIALFFLGLIIFAIIKGPVYIKNWQMQKLVKAKIGTITELKYQNIKSKVSEGWLTLSGTVNSLEQKMKIDSLVRTIDEIAGVHNRLIIEDTDSFAREITTRIQQKISQQADLRDLSLNFIVDNDQVIIEGEVPNLTIKREIAYLVSEIPGVNVVINNLKVQPAESFTIENIRNFLHGQIICFDVNDATLAEAEYLKLNAILNYLKKVNHVELVVKGYSDNLADMDYNLKLSKQRAQVVANYLTASDFPSDQILIEYYGKENPIASNDTEEGRAQNRRVEFDIKER